MTHQLALFEFCVLSFEFPEPQSYRSATSAFTRVVRHAGSHVASAATTAKRGLTPRTVTGSPAEGP